MKLRLHLLVLPRWFAAPVAIPSVVLGGILGGAPAVAIVGASILSLCLLAYAHSFNSWGDYVLTGFDRGPVEDRSHKKLYTSAQNLLSEGILTPREVLLNYLGWLVLVLVVGLFLYSRGASPWLWLPLGIGVACAPAYSYAKKLWCPEIPLGVGFGPAAVMIGMAVSFQPDLWRAFLAGIPLGIMFGGAAEIVDQWLDAEVNVGKGLRSLGVLAWQHHMLSEFLGAEITLAYIALAGLVVGGVLSVWSLVLALLSIPLLSFTISRITTQPETAIKVGLLGVFLFGALITVGQVVG